MAGADVVVSRPGANGKETLVRKIYPTTVNMDPALLKWYNMHQNRYKFFKWTPKAARVTLFYVILFPASIAYIAYKSEGKYSLRGKLRGDVIKDY